MGGLFSKPATSKGPSLPPAVVGRREMVIMSPDLEGSDGGAEARGFRVEQKQIGHEQFGGLFFVLKVTAVDDEGPAAVSGLEPRDVIVGVNGVSMFGKDEAALAKAIITTAGDNEFTLIVGAKLEPASPADPPLRKHRLVKLSRPSITDNLGIGVSALQGHAAVARVAKLEGADGVDTGKLAVNDVLVAMEGTTMLLGKTPEEIVTAFDWFSGTMTAIAVGVPPPPPAPEPILDGKREIEIDKDSDESIGFNVELEEETGVEGVISYIKVAELSEGGPAEKAGVKAGDILVSIEGKSLFGITIDGLAKLFERFPCVFQLVVADGVSKPDRESPAPPKDPDADPLEGFKRRRVLDMALSGKVGSTMGITFAVGGTVGSNPKVAAVAKKSPAYVAGVKVGDALISIAGSKRLLGMGPKRVPAALQWFVGDFTLTVASHGSGTAASAVEAEAENAGADDATYEPMAIPADGSTAGGDSGAGEIYSTMDHDGVEGGDIYSTMDHDGPGEDNMYGDDSNLYGDADEVDGEDGGGSSMFGRMKKSFKQSFRRSARKSSRESKDAMTPEQIEAALKSMIDEIRPVEIAKDEGHELDIELDPVENIATTQDNGEEVELSGLVRISAVDRHKCSVDVAGLDQLNVGDILVSIDGKINLLNKTAAEIAAIFEWFTDAGTPVELSWGEATEPAPDKTEPPKPEADADADAEADADADADAAAEPDVNNYGSLGHVGSLTETEPKPEAAANAEADSAATPEEAEPEADEPKDTPPCVLHDQRDADVVIIIAGDNVGIDLEVVDETGVDGVASFIRVTEVGEGMPGEKAGLKIGDIIASIEGTPLWGCELSTVGALFKENPSGFKLVVGSSITAAPAEDEEPPAEADVETSADLRDGGTDNADAHNESILENHEEAYNVISSQDEEAPFDITNVQTAELNLIGKHKCAGLKFAKVKIGSTRPPLITTVAKKGIAADAGVEADNVLISIRGTKSLLGVGFAIATAVIDKFSGSFTLRVATRNQVDGFDESHGNEGEAPGFGQAGDDDENGADDEGQDAEAKEEEEEEDENDDDVEEKGPRRKSVEELGENWMFATDSGEFADHVTLPADKEETATQKEEHRLNERQKHEEKLKEVRAERKAEKRQSLMKVKTALRRIVVLEDEVKAEPSKLVNPFLEKFGAKKTKAPQARWSNNKKVGRIVHLKEGEEMPAGAIDLPNLISPLERKTMEQKHNFTFLETKTETDEEFGFHYATDSDIEDEDDSFVPFDERNFQDERESMRLRMGVEEFAEWEIAEKARTKKEKEAAAEAEKRRLEEESAAKVAAAEAERIRLEEEAAAKEAEERRATEEKKAEEKRLAAEQKAAKKAKKEAELKEALDKVDAAKAATEATAAKDAAAANPAPAAADVPAPVATATATRNDSVEKVDGTVTAEHVGRRVAVNGQDGTGILRFVGPHHETGKQRCGVELDGPSGKNNGTVKGHTYFVCPENHGILVPPTKISLTNNTYDAGVPNAVKVKAAEAMKKKGNKKGSTKGKASEAEKGGDGASPGTADANVADAAGVGNAPDDEYAGMGRLKLIKLAKERNLDFKEISKNVAALRILLRENGGGAAAVSTVAAAAATEMEAAAAVDVASVASVAASVADDGGASAADGGAVSAASPEKKKKKKKKASEKVAGDAAQDVAVTGEGVKKKKKKKSSEKVDGDAGQDDAVTGEGVKKKKKKAKSPSADGAASDAPAEKPKKKKKKTKKADTAAN